MDGATSMHSMKNVYKILFRKPKEVITFRDEDTHGRITLKWSMESRLNSSGSE